jgi:choline-sulfatase
MPQPNILFIFTDQQSANMMSCVGNRYLRTPAMDSVGGGGVRFDRAYCTNPVCVPSRVSLMTGHMPGEFGIASNQDESVPEEVVENGLGALVRRAGYRAAYAGKIHLPDDLHPRKIGFEYLTDDRREGLAERCARFIRGDHDRPWMLVASFINPHDICFMAIRDCPSERQKNWLDPGRPHMQKVEEALRMPDGVSEEEFYGDHCPPLPPNFEIQPEEPEIIAESVRNSPFRNNARENWLRQRWRLHRWAYCRLTEMVDRQIGVVLEALQQSGQEDDTLVIFTSDHGDHDSAHRLEHKGTFYEEAIRIPLIIRPPGGTAGGPATSDDLVSNGLDLLPTICEYAGAEPPEDLEGRSLRPLVEGQSAAELHDHLPIECAHGRMVMTDRYKYMLYDDGENREQLIDRENDPGDMRNLVGDVRSAEELEDHRGLFAEVFGGREFP